MSRRLRIVVASLGGTFVLACGACAYVLQAMDEVQPFYAAALDANPEELESAGRQMESRVAALKSEVERTGRWQAVFTDAEVNGWLAVVLEEKYAKLLPAGVSDPRITFTPGGCQLGYRYQGRRFSAVVSVEGEAFMASDDVAAFRLRRALFGSLPLPMSEVVEEISKAAIKMEIPVTWTELEADPVLLVSVVDALSTETELRKLERVELRDGELLLAGKSGPRLRANTGAETQVQAAAGR
jgi:hypothetical protein